MTNAQMIVELRKETGASFGLVKEAVEAHPEDMAKAREFLMEKLRNTVSSRGEKETKNGIIEVYSHAPMKNVACMVEILCETDFVAKNELFDELGKNIALQVASMGEEDIENQDFIKDGSKKIIDLVKEVIAKTGENIRLGRVFKIELGK